MNSSEEDIPNHNPLVEDSSCDTIDNIRAVATFVQGSLSTDHAIELLKTPRAIYGLFNIFDCMVHALDYESARHDPARRK